jgi:hypothetical protein
VDVEGVLAGHELVGRGEDFRHREYDECTCGSRHPTYDNGRWPTHRAHVAAVLREQIAAAQAEAWDQGRAAGSRDVAARADDWTPNPYRAAQVAPSRVPGEET